ncbi:cytochrome-c oxidase, cbb3-type subunit II [Jiella marina]|uniref:cytochrome-c oxidase, cbb3-type subunit II n=1 Tax=Jiella sp. LLJ827 TaxID=2917712 RepID=UPI002101308B|nr:cytochrome-c oxidase, cbb3-type subunit II [Jiella sp. LLJ827]MCQ0988545.1 cytochrome-c oxidase, cbb3-type subunit II [Jiella sp. LLJ827]
MTKDNQDPALKGARPELKADPVARGILANHSKIEKNVTLLLVLSLITVMIGGIVEIAPLFYLENTIEKVKGMRPYSPLELAGRNIYIREGCYVCHSQMIRPFRDEVERYGHYSLAAESMYDHPFQWGSKRTGPDLARVGGRYSNDWHVEHLKAPRSVVPESIMPSYAFLASTELEMDNPSGHLLANRTVGVPYTDEMVENARNDLLVQAAADGDTEALLARYPKAVVGDFDGDPTRLTEMDALVAYLQMLGTLVDFSAYDPQENDR